MLRHIILAATIISSVTLAKPWWEEAPGYANSAGQHTDLNGGKKVGTERGAGLTQTEALSKLAKAPTETIDGESRSVQALRESLLAATDAPESLEETVDSDTHASTLDLPMKSYDAARLAKIGKDGVEAERLAMTNKLFGLYIEAYTSENTAELLAQAEIIEGNLTQLDQQAAAFGNAAGEYDKGTQRLVRDYHDLQGAKPVAVSDELTPNEQRAFVDFVRQWEEKNGVPPKGPTIFDVAHTTFIKVEMPKSSTLPPGFQASR